MRENQKKRLNIIMHPIAILIILVITQSCTKEVKLNITDSNMQPVINCLNKEGTAIKIYISKSVSIFSDSSNSVTTASAKLYINDSLAEIMDFDKPALTFNSSVKSESGSVYKVIIEIDNSYVILANDIMPYTPSLNNMSFQDSLLFNEYGDAICELIISISDTPAISNYYEVCLNAIYYYDSWDEPVISGINISHDYNIHPVFKNEGLMQYFPESYIFSDALFDGMQVNIPLRYSKINYIVNNESIKTTYELIVKFREISENYYKYRKQLIIHEWNHQGDIWDGVGEPVDMFTNIQGGYGIFAMYSEIVDTLTNPLKAK